MELQLAAALKQPGESFSFALEEPVGPQPFGGRTVAFAAPLSVHGRYVFDGKAVARGGHGAHLPALGLRPLRRTL